MNIFIQHRAVGQRLIFQRRVIFNDTDRNGSPFVTPLLHSYSSMDLYLHDLMDLHGRYGVTRTSTMKRSKLFVPNKCA
jgi:hypothetical protein